MYVSISQNNNNEEKEESSILLLVSEACTACLLSGMPTALEDLEEGKRTAAAAAAVWSTEALTTRANSTSLRRSTH